MLYALGNAATANAFENRDQHRYRVTKLGTNGRGTSGVENVSCRLYRAGQIDYDGGEVGSIGQRKAHPPKGTSPEERRACPDDRFNPITSSPNLTHR